MTVDQGHEVGVAREGEPPAVRQNGRELRGQEPMLGQQVARSLTAFGHERGLGRIEEYDSLRSERTGLGCAE